MTDRLKFAAFGGGLVALFGAAFGIGSLVGDPAGPAAGHHPSVTGEASGTGTIVDGYRVRMDGDLSTGGSEVSFTISKDGKPVADLQPYLGAYGHLVALRSSDLSYLHVHPEGEVGSTPAGPKAAFHAQAPSVAAYRLYLDFAHNGKVHTAEFTADAVGGATPGPNTHDQHGGGHQ